MNLLTLIPAALEERGNAVMVIARPEHGEDAVICYANRLLTQLMTGQATPLAGCPLSTLRSAAHNPADWSALVHALLGQQQLELDMEIRTPDREGWFGFGLSFKTDAADGANYGIVVGRDITQSRRRAQQEKESRRLMAALFLRISAPVVIVRADGTILMANPAYNHLLGYKTDEVIGANVSELTAAEYSEAARAARDRQFHDGATYEMQLDINLKGGGRTPVKLTSVLLVDGDQRLRVVTLLPHSDKPPAPAAEAWSGADDPIPLAPQIYGQMRRLSIAGFKTTMGDHWPDVMERATAIAEQIIRRRLDIADVVSRIADHTFVVWFASTDDQFNSSMLAMAFHDIRQRFLTEFAHELAERARAIKR